MCTSAYKSIQIQLHIYQYICICVHIQTYTRFVYVAVYLYVYTNRYTIELHGFLLSFFDLGFILDAFSNDFVDLGQFLCIWSYIGPRMPLGTILDPFWIHSGSILGPFWVHFGSILNPFWVTFGVPGGILRACFFFSSFFTFFGLVLGLVGLILESFWDPKTIQNGAKMCLKMTSFFD